MKEPYFAHRYPRGGYFHASPNRWWVEIHGIDEPIVTVTVRERVDSDPPSNYWGWLETGDDKYIFIWPSKLQVEMCFPYGTAVEEARGKGRLVNLIVEEV